MGATGGGGPFRYTVPAAEPARREPAPRLTSEPAASELRPGSPRRLQAAERGFSRSCPHNKRDGLEGRPAVTADLIVSNSGGEVANVLAKVLAAAALTDGRPAGASTQPPSAPPPENHVKSISPLPPGGRALASGLACWRCRHPPSSQRCHRCSEELLLRHACIHRKMPVAGIRTFVGEGS